MAALALVTATAVRAQEAPAPALPVRYPVSLPYLDCPQRRCDALQLVDFELQSGPQAGGGFRLRFADAAIAGFSWEHDRRSARIDTARLSAHYEDNEDGSLTAAASVRGARWLLRAAGQRQSDIAGGVWSVGGALSVRASSDVEVQASWLQAISDLAPAPVIERPQRMGRLAVRWQRGTRLELGAALSSESVVDGLGEAASRWGAEVRGEWLAGWLGLAGAIGYTDTDGRFAGQQLAAGLQLDARIGGHALLQLGGSERAALGVAEVDRSLHAGLSFFGRRYRFARGALAADAAARLAREALQYGYDERRVFEAPSQRAQRERLSLSGARSSLRDAIDTLYEAQVDDRNVEQMAVAIEESRDLELGSRIRSLGGRLGIPWPLAWPWSRGEDRVEFIRLYGRYTVAEFTEEAREYGREVGAVVWLNRELYARLAWESPHRTPLDLALGRLGDDWMVANLAWRLGY